MRRLQERLLNRERTTSLLPCMPRVKPTERVFSKTMIASKHGTVYNNLNAVNLALAFPISVVVVMPSYPPISVVLLQSIKSKGTRVVILYMEGSFEAKGEGEMRGQDVCVRVTSRKVLTFTFASLPVPVPVRPPSRLSRGGGPPLSRSRRSCICLQWKCEKTLVLRLCGHTS
jgi:hypothetical protein